MRVTYNTTIPAPNLLVFSDLDDGDFFVFAATPGTLCQRLGTHSYLLLEDEAIFETSAEEAAIYRVNVSISVNEIYY